jgi:hypothetical protein
MKTLFPLLVCVVALLPAEQLHAQRRNGPAPKPAPSADSPKSQEAYSISERGPHYRVWQRIETVTNAIGRVVTNRHSYTELATGLHFRRNGKWVETSEQIDLLPDGSEFGAAATNGPHQVFFPDDIYQGAIRTITSDGKRLTSRPTVITYFDGTNNVIIAELTNSIGQILPSGNQVIYTNCFPGLADILCTYRKSGFECDLIFRATPPAPKEFNLPDDCRIQLWTEWFDTPDPVPTRTNLGRDGLADSALNFGSLKMVRGKAFSILPEGQSKTAPAEKHAPAMVYKSWQKAEGRAFLIEELPVGRISGELDKLKHASIKPHDVLPSRRQARNVPLLPPARSIEHRTSQMQVAQTDLASKVGLVIDYTEVGDPVDSYTFKADTTYLVTNAFYVNYDITLEGNTVIKFPETSGQVSAEWVNCQTGPYRYAVLTSQNDNSIGETISGSSGNPAQGGSDYIYQYSDNPISYIRASYAEVALKYVDQNADVSNSQFVHCGGGVEVDVPDSEIRLHDCLFAHSGPARGDLIVRGENLTIDDCYQFSSGDYAYLTNCILVLATDS